MKAIEDYPEPKNHMERERCHGLFSYFRRSVPSFPRIAYAMARLGRQNISYVFSDECKYALQTLRQKLLEAPVWLVYNLSVETALHCDPRATGSSTVVSKKHSHGKFHPVSYFSETDSAAKYNKNVRMDIVHFEQYFLTYKMK